MTADWYSDIIPGFERGGRGLMISVIVPVYNSAKYIPACIDSMIKQEYPDWELLLVDDASTDDSADVCDGYASKDKRIKVIRAPHGGAAAARNRGIEEAKGEYICFADSDDTVEPDYLKYMYDAAIAHAADIVCCGHDEPKEGQEIRSAGDNGGFKKVGLDDLLYQRGLMSVPWGYLFKRSLFDEVRFPEGTEAEDMGTIYRLFMAAENAVKGDKVCYHYIQRSSSTIYTTASSRRKAYYRHSRNMLHVIKKQRPESYPAAASRHFSTCAQDLSETPLKEKGAFTQRLYKDMSRLSVYVKKDKEARMINRIAAYIIQPGPGLLHVLLRMYYCIKIWRMKRT